MTFSFHLHFGITHLFFSSILSSSRFSRGCNFPSVDHDSLTFIVAGYTSRTLYKHVTFWSLQPSLEICCFPPTEICAKVHPTYEQCTKHYLCESGGNHIYYPDRFVSLTLSLGCANWWLCFTIITLDQATKHGSWSFSEHAASKLNSSSKWRSYGAEASREALVLPLLHWIIQTRALREEDKWAQSNCKSIYHPFCALM